MNTIATTIQNHNKKSKRNKIKKYISVNEKVFHNNHNIVCVCIYMPENEECKFYIWNYSLLLYSHYCW